MSPKFIVHGGKKLNGEVTVSGSKNAALPIIAASLLTDQKVILKNVPDIQDIHTYIEILTDLGIECEFQNNTLTLQSKNIKNITIPEIHAKKLRASILFLAPLLARNKHAALGFPGGCVLGKRPIDVHTHVLKKLGAKIVSEDPILKLSAKKLIGTEVIIPEMSVTATENLITAAVLAEGKTKIKLAASEPHVQDLCKFLKKMGAKISGIGTPFLEVTGVKSLKGTTHTIISDYLEVGTFAIAAAATRGNVKIKGVHRGDLDALWNKFEEVGVPFELGKDFVHILPTRKKYKHVSKLQTGVFPAFPTDLQAPFGILLSQAHGMSKIHETLFEGRLSYLFELEKMGGRIEMMNPHQAVVLGPAKLKGTPITSCDIRAGAGMIIAALIAEGQTEISAINYTLRGYENIDKKLQALGASIEKIEQ